MINNKIIVRIIGVVFIIIIIVFFIFGTPRYQSMKTKSEGFSDLATKLKASTTKSEIDMNKLTNFVWDECYVFTPYYPSKAVYEMVGTEWTTSKTFIGFLMSHSAENETVNDDQFLIVFKKANKVVLAKRYSLSELPVIFKLDNYKFTSNNAKFLVGAAKQYDEGKVKELVLKN